MPQRQRRRRERGPASSELRIIGGRWRGRRLTFEAAPGLRPTSDRVRETLFNWLAPELHGARCLDLFCGSGALGLESLSRGAGYCDFVDISGASLRQVQAHLQQLDASALGSCHSGDARDFLANTDDSWDIVFVDPPFGQDLAVSACQALAKTGRLARGGWVYLETGRDERVDGLPADWRQHRDKTAGAVRYQLFHWDTAPGQLQG